MPMQPNNPLPPGLQADMPTVQNYVPPPWWQGGGPQQSQRDMLAELLSRAQQNMPSIPQAPGAGFAPENPWGGPPTNPLEGRSRMRPEMFNQGVPPPQFPPGAMMQPIPGALPPSGEREMLQPRRGQTI